MNSYPRFCQPSSAAEATVEDCTVIYLAIACAMAALCGLQGVILPCPQRCDEIQQIRYRLPCDGLAEPTRLAPGCTLAWPDALLHPPVGSYPTLSALTPLPSCKGNVAGFLSVAVVVTTGLRPLRPHLLFRGAAFPGWFVPSRTRVGKFLCQHKAGSDGKFT